MLLNYRENIGALSRDQNLHGEGVSEESRAMLGLRVSARGVTTSLGTDEQQIPDPWDLVQSSFSRDYVAEELSSGGTLLIRKIHAIPDILLAQLDKEDGCLMGLLPVIGRAWMAVGRKLYLWDYANLRDYTCFDGEVLDDGKSTSKTYT